MRTRVFAVVNKINDSKSDVPRFENAAAIKSEMMSRGMIKFNVFIHGKYLGPRTPALYTSSQYFRIQFSLIYFGYLVPNVLF